MKPSIAAARRFYRQRPMIMIFLFFGLVLAAAVLGVAGMQERKVIADKDKTVAQERAHIPAQLLEEAVIPPAPSSGMAVTPSSAPAAEPLPPQQATAPARPAPTIEEMARVNAAAAAWSDYYAARAALEKKRVEAISAGLISPMRSDAMQASSRRGASAAPATAPAAASLPAGNAGPSFAGLAGLGQQSPWMAADSKQAWAGQTGPNGPDYLPSARHGTVSAYEIMAGTSIPAITKGGMISDAPGQIVGQVSRDVHCNTPAGGVCVPQGSTLILTYNNRVANGETRLQVAAERLIFPDSTSMDLGRMVVAEAAGYSGLEDEYETHLGVRLLNATLFSAVQGAFTLGSAALGANQVQGQAVEAVAAEETRAGLRIPPTLRIRPGFPFLVVLPKDLVFEGPYSPLPHPADEAASD